MNEETDDNKFTWGDSVIIRENTPSKFQPGKLASICGFYKLQSEETEKEFGCKTGEWIYTVEFGDGSDIQIPERYLDKISFVSGGELSKYGHYFVNGIISEVILNVDFVEIEIKSSFVDQQISDDKILLKNNFLVGKLSAIKINNIFIKNSNYYFTRQRIGSILTFEISDHIIKLNIEWEKTKTTLLEIEADQIWWQQVVTEIKK
jgi:hypothetical protein